MAFPVLFFIGMVCITTFNAMNRQLTKMENSALILSVFILNVNWSWIIYDELQYITYSTFPLNYAAYVIHRSLIIPLLVVIGINSIPRNASIAKKLIGVLLSSIILLLVMVLLRQFEVVTYEKWNAVYSYLYYVFLHGFGYLVLYGYHSWVLKGVKS
ncbi:hypothetical protein J7E71_25525 [Mesobacillus foraminis]|uniref:hypothetical protein n=1 Tax=Mesobacillus foraminis TaxID=279826 RepID=UPI001BEB496F|nr:hypothetical protein [Mesobacillus foraminis]MBT2759236.1 hypothetical protein [Mesobacillus foraminis]